MIANTCRSYHCCAYRLGTSRSIYHACHTYPYTTHAKNTLLINTISHPTPRDMAGPPTVCCCRRADRYPCHVDRTGRASVPRPCASDTFRNCCRGHRVYTLDHRGRDCAIDYTGDGDRGFDRYIYTCIFTYCIYIHVMLCNIDQFD